MLQSKASDPVVAGDVISPAPVTTDEVQFHKGEELVNIPKRKAIRFADDLLNKCNIVLVSDITLYFHIIACMED